MKTSVLLLPLLLAASPSFADGPQHRCDAAWLAKADQLASAGAIPPDDKKYLKSEDYMGGTRQVLDIGAAPALCDATVWHYLAVVGPANGDATIDPKTHQPIGGLRLQWRDEGLQAAWGLGLAQQAKILEMVDEMYTFVDARGAKALAASDAVAEAAVKMGVVKRTELPAAKIAGLSHAQYDAAKAYSLEPADGKTSTPPADLKAALQVILAQAPAPAAKKGQKALPAPTEPLLGPGVLAFRKAVIDLADELAVRARRRDLAQKWGVDAKLTRDYAAGALPVFAAFAGVKGADGSPTVPDSVAMKDENYKAALQYVTDPGIKDPADASAHPNSGLSALDYGLRNLIAVRAAAVDAAVAAAKKSLNGRSVKETLAGLDREDQRIKDENGVEMEAAKGLNADVAAALAKTKEFSDLNALFENNKAKDAKWLESSDGKAVAAQLQRMKDDASATRGIMTKQGSALEYTVGGLKVRNEGVRVADLGGKEYRAAIADAVAQNIASGNDTQVMLAKFKAAIDAIKGAGPVAAPLTPDQAKLADQKLPKKPEPAAKPEPTPWQALLAATPAKGFFSFLGRDKSSVERYYSKFNEEQADAAHKRMAQRTETQREADEAYRGVVENADEGRQKVLNAPMDPDDSKAVQDQKRAAALKAYNEDLERRAQAARQAAIDKATKEKRFKADEDIAAQRAEQHRKLMATIDGAYSDGIKTSIGALHADYLKPGTKRRNAAEELSGYSGEFYRGDRVSLYFKNNWPMDKNPAPEIETCKSKLGFKLDFNGSEFRVKDPTADNVDGACEVRKGLVLFLSSYRGKNAGEAAPAAPVVTK